MTPPGYVAAVIPLYSIIGLGFALKKVTRIQINPLLEYTVNIGAPFLVFSQLYSANLGQEAPRVMLAALSALLAMTFLSAVLLRAFSVGSVRPALLPSILPNAGNMGLPLVAFAFGDAAMPLAVAYFIVSSIYTNTVGVFIAASHRRGEGLAETLKSPLVYAAILGFLLNRYDVRLPEFLQRITQLLGETAIPLLLITLGAKLAEVGGRVRLKESILPSVLRLAGGFLVGSSVARGLGLAGVERQVVVLQSSMPSAVFSYLLSEKFQAKPELASSAVVITTSASLFTLPLLLLYLA